MLLVPYMWASMTFLPTHYTQIFDGMFISCSRKHNRWILTNSFSSTPPPPRNLFINRVKAQLARNLLSLCQKPPHFPREFGHHRSKPTHLPTSVANSSESSHQVPISPTSGPRPLPSFGEGDDDNCLRCLLLKACFHFEYQNKAKVKEKKEHNSKFKNN